MADEQQKPPVEPVEPVEPAPDDAQRSGGHAPTPPKQPN